MKKSAGVLIGILMMLMFASSANAVISLKLPYKSGERWLVTQGIGQGTTHQGNNYYAWDFSKPIGTGETCNNDLGAPAFAPASGTVTFAGTAGGWGKTVVIDYGSGLFGRLAHLNSVIVSVDQRVYQGEQIGTVGNTGNTGDPPCTHIHYQTQDVNGISINPIGNAIFTDPNVLAQNPDGVPTENNLYIAQTLASTMTFMPSNFGLIPGLSPNIQYFTDDNSTAETDNEVAAIITKPGTIKNLYVRCVSNSLSGNTVFTIMKNGVATNPTLSVTIPPGSCSPANNTNNFVAVVAGDKISIQVDISASSTPLPIVSSTNTSPIRVQVIGHGYQTGDQVVIRDHQVNTNANGQWTITRIDNDHFDLDFWSEGNGVGGATGTAQKVDWSKTMLKSIASFEIE